MNFLLFLSLSFLLGGNPSVAQAQDLFQIEYSRDANDPGLLHSLRSANSKRVAQAVKVAGRIGAGYPLPEVVYSQIQNLMTHPSAAVRAEAAYVLGTYRFENEEAKEKSRVAVANALKNEFSTLALSRELLALGAIGNADDLKTLFNTAKSNSAFLVKQSALMGIYAVAWNARPKNIPFLADDELIEQLLLWMQKSSSAETEVPAQAIFAMAGADRDLSKRPIAQKMIQAASLAKLDRARSWLLLSLSARDPLAFEAEMNSAEDPSPQVRGTFAAFIAPFFPDKTLGIPSILKLLNDPVASVRYAASMGLKSLLKDAAAKAVLLEKFSEIELSYHASVTIGVKENLLQFSVKLSPSLAEPLVRAELQSKDIHIQGAALSELGNFLKPTDLNMIELMVKNSKSPYLAQSAMTAIQTAGEASVNDGVKQAILDLVASADPGALLFAEEFSKWKSFTEVGDSLAVAYEKTRATHSASHLSALLNGIASSNKLNHLDVIEDALHSLDPRVVKVAKEAYLKLTGKPSEVVPPTVIPVESPLPSAQEIKEVFAHAYAVTTSKGVFHLRLNPKAPIAAVNFVRMAKAGKYDHSEINWLYPGYMMEFGDQAEGSGTAFPLASFRDELVSPFEHRRGALCFSGTGVDSYSGTFLVDFAYRFYDARTINSQTTFGFVTSGMDVMESLELYDEILSVSEE